MTIDEAIKQEREFALKCRESVEIAIRENEKYDSDNIGSLRIYETIQANKDVIETCTRKAEYHEQLAEWLEELKKLKEERKEIPIATITFSKKDLQKMVDEKVKDIELDIQEIRNQAIEDFVEIVRRKFPDDRNAITNLEIIAEQLKEGGVDE